MNEPSAPRRWRFPTWLIYLIFGGLLLAVLGVNTARMFRQAPDRDATADLGEYGLVTIRFSTNPNPALPTGVVTLRFTPMNARQQVVPLDRITFEYGREGEDVPAGSGEAERAANNSGMFVGGAQFPQVGTWWLRATVSRGAAQAEVRYTIYVEPAQ